MARVISILLLSNLLFICLSLATYVHFFIQNGPLVHVLCVIFLFQIRVSLTGFDCQGLHCVLLVVAFRLHWLANVLSPPFVNCNNLPPSHIRHYQSFFGRGQPSSGLTWPLCGLKPTSPKTTTTRLGCWPCLYRCSH